MALSRVELGGGPSHLGVGLGHEGARLLFLDATKPQNRVQAEGVLLHEAYPY